MTKTACRIQHKKRIEAQKIGRDGYALYKLMNNDMYSKTMGNLRNRIDVRLVSNEKDYLKLVPKSSYTSQEMFDNDLVSIRKDKATLIFQSVQSIEFKIDIIEYEFMKSINFRSSHFDLVNNFFVKL